MLRAAAVSTRRGATMCRSVNDRSRLAQRLASAVAAPAAGSRLDRSVRVAPSVAGQRASGTSAPGLRRLPLNEQELLATIEGGCERGPVAAHEGLVARGVLEREPAQAECAVALQGLWESLRTYRKERTHWEEEHRAWRVAHEAWTAKRDAEEAQRKAEAEKRTQGAEEQPAAVSSAERETHLEPEPVEPPEPESSTYGCYIWGGVGGGKSLLMDVFVDCCAPKSGLGITARRVHFHDFMHEVHQELHQLRKGGSDKTTQAVARRIAREAQLLAFDEFQITNISDALIIETLFDALFRCGVAVVMTSNRPPEDLYKDGLNRHLAVPQFLDLLGRRRVTFVELAASRDFRVAQSSSSDAGSEDGPWRDFFVKEEPGHSAEAEEQLRLAFAAVSGSSSRGQPRDVPVAWGRSLVVSEAAPGIGRFTFDELCGDAINADDYLHLTEHFHTIVLADVPHFSLDQHNEARRFTNLVDCLYERHARLILSADVAPKRLLEKMTALSTIELKHAEQTSRAEVSQGSGDWIRQNPFSPEALSIEDAAVRAASSAGASVKAGDDDTATGAGVAGVMAGALGSLQESGFAAGRATSRLLHMQTEDYLLAHQRHHALALH